MDVAYIKAFILAVKSVFSTMLNAEVEVGKPRLKDSASGPCEVSSIIGFSGDFQGCVVLCFGREVAQRVASQFARIEINSDSDDFADAMGELANMVAGSAKGRFTGHSVSISLPSVVIGKDHVISGQKEVPVVSIPCTTMLGEFSVEVSFVPNKKPAGAVA